MPPTSNQEGKLKQYSAACSSMGAAGPLGLFSNITPTCLYRSETSYIGSYNLGQPPTPLFLYAATIPVHTQTKMQPAGARSISGTGNLALGLSAKHMYDTHVHPCHS